MGAFTSTNGVIVPFCNSTSHGPGGDSNGTVVLLTGINPVGELVIHIGTVKLGRGLVVVCAPGGTCIKGDLTAAVIGNNKMLGIQGINPKIMVVTVGGTN